MKANLIFIFCAAFFCLSGCQKTSFVNPTNQNEGPTSLTAIFSSGTYVDKEAVVYTVPDQSVERFVIPVPYYYPESSDNTTEAFMSSMKVRAGLPANCSISPSLGVLDLTKDNLFTYTDEMGKSRKIVITGQRVRSDKDQILSFIVDNQGLTGVIDQDKKEISLISVDDLAGATATVSLSSHAKISPDPSLPQNYNDTVRFTVTADNGDSSAVYKVFKSIPSKIAYGFRSGSGNAAFTVDLTTMGLPSVSHPSLAALGNNLVVDYGDGSTPLYFNKATGTRQGSINIGNASANGCIASDNANYMLISNYVDNGGVLRIYKASTVTGTPSSYISFLNMTGFPLGARMSVQGDLDSNAVITSVCDGNAVSGSSTYVRWIVLNGVVQSPETITLSGISSWGGLDLDAKVVYRSTNVSDGSFAGHYDGGNDNLYYLNGNNAVTATLAGQSDGSGWGMNNGVLDARTFNNARYLALYSVSFFPQWGMNSSIYLYDVTSTATFKGNVDASSSLVFSLPSVTSYNSSTPSEPRTGDVLLQSSSNGYKLSLFYIDNTCKVLGCYEFDCINK